MPGFQFIEIPADENSPAFEGAVWYPCAGPPGEISLGDITARFGLALTGAKDVPFSGENLPLVVMWHGRGGNFFSHHDTAAALADAGFIIAAVTHPLDRAPDGKLAGGLSAYIERPRDIKRLVDFMLGASPLASNIDAQRIGFCGFSRGGQTGLILIGTNPDWSVGAAFWEIPKKEFPTQPLTHDPRITAAVIADPASVLFTADALAPVRVPVQLWASEHGGDGITDRGIAAVDRNLPAPHEYHVVPNSGHFAFLAPCPPALAKAVPEICTDAPGFDRVAFHKQFNAAVLKFFRTYLVGGPANHEAR